MGTEVVDCMELEVVRFCALLQDVYTSARMLIMEDLRAQIMYRSSWSMKLLKCDMTGRHCVGTTLTQYLAI
jgi:hypothetical protein